MLDYLAHAFDLHGIATPVVLPAVQHGSIHGQSESIEDVVYEHTAKLDHYLYSAVES